jgi:putative SOS response-associated peptidase YedK
MCGRYFLLVSGKDLADLFQLFDVPDLAPCYNIAPTQPVAVVRIADQARELVRLRWGLIASWAKDAKLAQINARSETAADKPTFRHAMKKRRCLIPGSGFYEWQALGKKQKQPYCFRMADDKPFAFAGLWERWHGPDGDVESCCILTTEANELVSPVHDRMPVILDPQHFGTWIDRTVQEPAALAPMLRPFDPDRMRAYPVNPWVNDARHDDLRCLEPAT